MYLPKPAVLVQSPYYFSRRWTKSEHPGNGIPIANEPVGMFVLNSEQEVVSSTTTPGFDMLKRRKKPLPENNYSKAVDEFIGGVGSISRITTHKELLYPGHGANEFRDSFSSITAAAMGCKSLFSPDMPQSNAYQKAFTKVMDAASLTKSQSAVSALELDKTAKMITTTATRIYNSVKSLRRGHIGTFAASIGIVIPKKQTTIWLRDHTKYLRGSTHTSEFKFSKRPKGRFVKQFRQQGTVHVNNFDDFLSKSWLEYSYGWMPLLQDLHDTAEASASVMFKQTTSQITTVSRTASDQNEISGRYNSSNESIRYESEETMMTSVRIVVRFKLKGDVPIHVAFGLNNPALIAWELVPFSFVVDWFLPIGSFIESFTAFEGLDFQGGAVITKTTKSLVSRCSAGKPIITDSEYGPETTTWENCNLSLSRKSFTFTRAKLLDWPRYGLPALKSPVSFRHALTSVALVQSLFIGRAR